MPGTGVLKIHDQVPGSLDYPRGDRVRRHAQHPDPAAMVLDHRAHEHPHPRQGDRLEEATGHEGLCLGAQEAGPGRGRASGCGIGSRPPPRSPTPWRCHLKPEHEQLTVRAPVPHPGAPGPGAGPGREPSARCGAARPPGPGPGSVPLPDQFAVPAQHRVKTNQQPHPAKLPRPEPVRQLRQQDAVRRYEAHPLPAQLALCVERFTVAVPAPCRAMKPRTWGRPTPCLSPARTKFSAHAAPRTGPIQGPPSLRPSARPTPRLEATGQ